MALATPRRRVPHAPLWVGLGLFAAALALYIWTLAPGLVRGDGGELQFILATLGVAHPTGYPLYSLLGWLWTKLLPFGSVAWRINLLSACFGAGAVALVYGIVYRLTRRVIPALAGALFLGLSPLFWVLSSVTEVYALHALFVAAVLYLLLAWRDAGRHRFRILVLTAFVYGLSLSHHRMMVLLAPAIGLFLLLESNPGRDPCEGSEPRGYRQGLPRTYRQGFRRSLVLVAAFLAGLLPYLHVFIQQLHRGRTVQHVIWNVILGGDFAGFLGLRSDPLTLLWDLPRQQIGLLGLIAAVLGLAWLVWKQRTAAWLLGTAWLANLAFCLFYRVPDIEDFTLPMTLILAIWAGSSAGWLSLRQAGDNPTSPLRFSAPVRYGLELTLLLVALLSVRHLPQVQAGVAERDGGLEAQARALLAYPFEPDATVIADWDLAMAVRFLRAVEGAGPGAISSANRVNAVRLGREKACDSLRTALAEGGPVYTTPGVQITRLPDGYRFEEAPPYLKISRQPASYTRLDRPLDPQLTLEGVQRQGRLLVLRWLVTGSPLAADYTTYAHYFDAAGQPLGQQDKGMGAELSCWYPPTTWPPGQVIQDLYLLPSGTASVRVGLYTLRDGQVEPQGTDTTVDLP